MPIFTLSHPTLPSEQTVTVAVPEGREIGPEYERAGWLIDSATDDDGTTQVATPATDEKPAEPVDPTQGV